MLLFIWVMRFPLFYETQHAEIVAAKCDCVGAASAVSAFSSQCIRRCCCCRFLWLFSASDGHGWMQCSSLLSFFDSQSADWNERERMLGIAEW